MAPRRRGGEAMIVPCRRMVLPSARRGLLGLLRLRAGLDESGTARRAREELVAVARISEELAQPMSPETAEVAATGVRNFIAALERPREHWTMEWAREIDD